MTPYELDLLVDTDPLQLRDEAIRLLRERDELAEALERFIALRPGDEPGRRLTTLHGSGVLAKQQSDAYARGER